MQLTGETLPEGSAVYVPDSECQLSPEGIDRSGYDRGEDQQTVCCLFLPFGAFDRNLVNDETCPEDLL
jgi:hypothetical protein